MKLYEFNESPETYQPTGFTDFSKIYTPKNIILTYTNLNTQKTEQHNIERTKIINKDKIKKVTYKFPPPTI